jgi:Response receiver domain
MTSAFAAHVEAVVTNFLETAIVVDDEGLPSEPRTEADDAPVAVRTREDLTLAEPDPEQLAAAEEERPLNTRELLDAFADMGVVCALLAPLEDDAIRDRLLNAAARADLVVLDWELHRDGGRTALNLITSLLDQDDAAERRRLRVIAIYTGQTGLASIVDRVRRALQLQEDSVAPDGMTLTTKNVRIVAFSKRLDGGKGEPTHPREVSESQLPGVLARQFAELSSGLVPCVALAALAAVRNETHRLLQALRADMDIGYLGHRVASPFPEDAEEHLVDVVAAEIASVLSDGDIGIKADLNAIHKWLDDEYAASPPLQSGSALDQQKHIEHNDLKRMLELGLGREETFDEYGSELSKGTLRKVRRQAAHLFTNTSDKADESSAILALRMATRTLYRRPPRVLQLGTIVLSRDGFMVCVQPRCDSVRLALDTPRAFPFLPLEIAEGAYDGHQFVVARPEDNALTRLRVQGKPFAIRTFRFNADQSRSVRARWVKGFWSFYTTGNRRFRWVADLKPEFAQRVAVDLGAELARVGLAESELVRLSQRA